MAGRDALDPEQVAERRGVCFEQPVVRQIRRLAEDEERRDVDTLEGRRLAGHLAVRGHNRALAVPVTKTSVVVGEEVVA